MDLFLSLAFSFCLSFSTRPLRRFVCAAIRVSTHTRCAHNRLREAKAPLIPSLALLLAFLPLRLRQLLYLFLSHLSLFLARFLYLPMPIYFFFSPRTLQHTFGQGSHRLLLECLAFVPSRSRPGRSTVLRLREKEASCSVQPATPCASRCSFILFLSRWPISLLFYLSTT